MYLQNYLGSQHLWEQQLSYRDHHKNPLSNPHARHPPPNQRGQKRRHCHVLHRQWLGKKTDTTQWTQWRDSWDRRYTELLTRHRYRSLSYRVPLPLYHPFQGFLILLPFLFQLPPHIRFFFLLILALFLLFRRAKLSAFNLMSPYYPSLQAVDVRKRETTPAVYSPSPSV